MKIFNPSALLVLVLPWTINGCGKKEKESEIPKYNQVINRSVEQPEVDPGLEAKKQLAEGKAALRFETFGNEAFWSDVVKLSKGMLESKFTPAKALQIGLSINTEALDAETLSKISEEIKMLGLKAPVLNDSAMTVKLLNANAIVGLVVKDTNHDKQLDVTNGDKLGVSCVLCHAVTDRSVMDVPAGGAIGKQIDGPSAHSLQMGKLFAVAANTKGFYPMAQLRTAGGRSIGRAPSYEGLFNYYGEADFDAYFSNPKYYPAGMFDDTLDGHGNPVQTAPLFRQDLAAPFGSAGEKESFIHYANTVYTLVLDPTILVTEHGRAYLTKIAGTSGDRIAKEYLEVLEEIGVRKYGLVKTNRVGDPGKPETMAGVGVDMSVLQAMEAYAKSLRAPAGIVKDVAAVERGKAVFLNTGNKCLNCHNLSQAIAVRPNIVDMKVIFPGDSAAIIGKRELPFNPMMNTAGKTFDDKMIIANASMRGLARGAAMPLLLDLGRKTRFLHDASVEKLEKLFDSGRGSKAPHPFYVSAQERADLVQFLESLDDSGN